MSKIFSTKFTSSTRRTVTKVISVMLVAVIALLGAGRPANAQPNQSPRDYAICGMTDANGRFSLPTGARGSASPSWRSSTRTAIGTGWSRASTLITTSGGTTR